MEPDTFKQSRPWRVARTLDHRLKALAWLRGAMQRWPCGFVQVNTAARVLGVSRTRVQELIDAGRLPCITGLPGGSKWDRFIPIDALLGAPTPLASGRPKDWHKGKSYLESVGVCVNQWSKSASEPTPNVDNLKKR